MASEQITYIICSMRARNGKTTLARLLADYLTLTRSPPVVFDTDLPQGHISHFYNDRSMLIDVEKIPGQMQLFDTMLGRFSDTYVLDLSHRAFGSFLQTVKSINFETESRAHNLNISVFYILDRDRESRGAFRLLAEDFPGFRFFAVENYGLENADEQQQMIGQEFVNMEMPRLDPSIFPIIADPQFSFLEFMENPPNNISVVAKAAIRNWIQSMFEQMRHISLDISMFDSDFLN